MTVQKSGRVPEVSANEVLPLAPTVPSLASVARPTRPLWESPRKLDYISRACQFSCTRQLPVPPMSRRASTALSEVKWNRLNFGSTLPERVKDSKKGKHGRWLAHELSLVEAPRSQCLVLETEGTFWWGTEEYS
jgi:hypothetical protein